MNTTKQHKDFTLDEWYQEMFSIHDKFVESECGKPISTQQQFRYQNDGIK